MHHSFTSLTLHSLLPENMSGNAMYIVWGRKSWFYWLDLCKVEGFECIYLVKEANRLYSHWSMCTLWSQSSIEIARNNPYPEFCSLVITSMPNIWSTCPGAIKEEASQKAPCSPYTCPGSPPTLKPSCSPRYHSPVLAPKIIFSSS